MNIYLKNLKKINIPISLTKEEYIELITQEPIRMLGRNEKMVKTGKGFYQTTLPALKGLICNSNKDCELSFFTTCPKAGICAAYCYGGQGTFNFSNAKIDHIRKLNLLINNRKRWVERMLEEIKKKRVVYLRWHDAGDFFDKSYLETAFKIMRQTSSIKHYTYTKMIELFESIPKDEIPENFTVVYSYGGKEDHMINPAIHRHSRIFNTERELEKEGYISGMNSDMIATDKSIKKVGLVYHGNKKMPTEVFDTKHSHEIIVDNND